MIEINADRPALQVTRSDKTTTWEYDVITLKIEAERLEEQHGLRDGKLLKSPTNAFLVDYAAALVEQGLEGCTVDLALRVYSLVAVQFRQMQLSIAEQVAQQ